VGGLAGVDEFFGDPFGLVDGDGEAEPDGTGLTALVGAAVGGPDGGVDADDAGLRVEEGPAGVAGVDRRIGDSSDGSDVSTTGSPTWTLSELPRAMGLSPRTLLTLTTARS